MYDRTGTAPEDTSGTARRFSAPLAFRTDRQSSRSFHLAVDNLPDGILVVDGAEKSSSRTALPRRSSCRVRDNSPAAGSTICCQTCRTRSMANHGTAFVIGRRHAHSAATGR